jgi:hypothetical protein
MYGSIVLSAVRTYEDKSNMIDSIFEKLKTLQCADAS